MVGFGGSFTDAGAWSLNYLSATDRAAVVAAYFGPSGANYEVCRSQMGASDFSAGLYSYDDQAGDYSLSHFTMAHDSVYMLPWEKEAITLNPDLKIFGSPWSAPGWMKTSGQMDNGGTLLPSCDTTWSLYFVKWYQAYKAFGVTPWGVTVQNEPRRGPILAVHDLYGCCRARFCKELPWAYVGKKRSWSNRTQSHVSRS